mmetsp:Transcript_7958/g.26131  ORF Transcript_7958/g.26131 Transcript_7958/m.26131 type:complete len:215 (-) Transcript_7958:37-681(-)
MLVAFGAEKDSTNAGLAPEASVGQSATRELNLNLRRSPFARIASLSNAPRTSLSLPSTTTNSSTSSGTRKVAAFVEARIARVKASAFSLKLPPKSTTATPFSRYSSRAARASGSVDAWSITTTFAHPKTWQWYASQSRSKYRSSLWKVNSRTSGWLLVTDDLLQGFFHNFTDAPATTMTMTMTTQAFRRRHRERKESPNTRFLLFFFFFLSSRK